MRSWKLRRPSAGVARRLFDRREASLWQPAFMRVLVPAAACLILTVVALNQPVRDGGAPLGDGPTLMAMSLSNQNYAAYLPGSFQCEANRLDTFGWTNGGGITSPMHFVSPDPAND
ncbi:MAG: hypothetical protein EXS35_10800 [Pedosphaera sp.]|nr:hypothetical protein [Pedosphaera sp.]